MLPVLIVNWSSNKTIPLMGEGFSGTTIKDTWTKPRGRVEEGDGGGFGWGGVEGWVENADQCNLTTIKHV